MKNEPVEARNASKPLVLVASTPPTKRLIQKPSTPELDYKLKAAKTDNVATSTDMGSATYLRL
jgi:hypothetical protein